MRFFILLSVLLIETCNLYVWSLTSAILITIRYLDRLALIRHQTEIVIAVDNWKNLLTITTLQVQANQESRDFACIANHHFTLPFFAFLLEPLTLDSDGCHWKFGESLQIVLLFAHHIEVI